MGGRPSKPTDLIIFENKSHIGKVKLDARKSAETALYTGVNFTEAQQVKDNQIAHKEFLRLKNLYGKIAFVDALDKNIINRYCLEVAQLYDLQEHIARLNKDLEMTEQIEQRITLYGMINQVYVSMEKSKALLLKYEDRLFLNPAGRMRAIPKTPTQEAVDIDPMKEILNTSKAWRNG